MEGAKSLGRVTANPPGEHWGLACCGAEVLRERGGPRRHRLCGRPNLRAVRRSATTARPSGVRLGPRSLGHLGGHATRIAGTDADCRTGPNRLHMSRNRAYAWASNIPAKLGLWVRTGVRAGRARTEAAYGEVGPHGCSPRRPRLRLLDEARDEVEGHLGVHACRPVSRPAETIAPGGNRDDDVRRGGSCAEEMRPARVTITGTPITC